jgi:N-methylhydantoinase A/oxoprolinase/acetone carboxylase beta subunit
VASGFLAIAVDHMAIAIKEVTTRRGVDVSGYALCSFGGAGGQHACLVADALGIETVINIYMCVCILFLSLSNEDNTSIFLNIPLFF